MTIPILNTMDPDEWYWLHNPSWSYSVKTGYQCLRLTKEIQVPESIKQFWMVFWNTKVPPMVLQMLWRACNNILPTKQSLRLKGVPIDVLCPLCLSTTESINHVPIDCCFAKSCWSHLLNATVSSQQQSFASWLQLKVSEWSPDMVAKAFTLCWAIWKGRNELVWNNHSMTPSSVTMLSHYTLTQWTNAQQTILQPLENRSNASPELWTKPTRDIVKVNVDAAVFPTQGKYGIGGVARNHLGEVLGSFQRSKYGGISVETAEALALKEALSWMKEMHWTKVRVETDSLRVVQALHQRNLSSSPFAMIIQACKDDLMYSPTTEVSHVKRSANCVAHMLASTAVCFPDCNLSWDQFPPNVASLVRTDLI